MKKLYFIIVLLGLFVSSCEKEAITPNQPTPPNPIDTTDTSGTNGYTKHFILEFFSSTSGYNLYQTVDSVRFTNVTTGDTELWLGDSTTWSNYTYPYNGNYHVFYIPTPSYGDELNVKVYFNTNEYKGCLATFNESTPGFNTASMYTGQFTLYNYTYYY